MPQQKFIYHLTNGKTMELEGDTMPSDDEVDSIAKEQGVSLQLASTKNEPSKADIDRAMSPMPDVINDKPLNVERASGPSNPSAERRHQEDYNSKWGQPGSSIPITDPISKKGRDWLAKPLTDAPSRFGKQVSQFIDPEQGGSGMAATVSAFVESVMNMASQATSPREILTNLLTGGTAAKMLRGKGKLSQIADDMMHGPSEQPYGPVEKPPIDPSMDSNLQGGMGDPMLAGSTPSPHLESIANDVAYGPQQKPYFKLKDGSMQQVERPPVSSEIDELTTAHEPEVSPGESVDFESPVAEQQLPESWNTLAQRPKSTQQILNEAAIMKRRQLIESRRQSTVQPEQSTSPDMAPSIEKPPIQEPPIQAPPEVFPPDEYNMAAPNRPLPSSNQPPVGSPQIPPVKSGLPPPNKIPGAILTNNQKAKVAMMTQPQQKESAIRKVLDFNRTLVTAYDMSAPLRQGLGMITHKEFWTSLDDMFKSVGSKRGYETVMKSIEDDPSGYFKRGQSPAGVALPSYAEKVGLAVHDIPEEIFRGAGARVAEKYLPGVAQSNRGYNAYIAKLRADGFKRLVKEATVAGKDPENDMVLGKKIADFINTATGRGDLGKLEPVVKQLSDVFFAPRLMASRLQTYNNALNPYRLYKADPMLRREALRSLFGVVASGGLISGMSKAAGADVTLDPRSTDFMKIHIGNSRYDPFGGYQQYAVNTAKFITGQSVSSKSGKVSDLTTTKFGQDTRADLATRFFTNKLAPVPSLIWSWMSNKEFDGTPFDTKKAILTRTVPIFMQDMNELLQEDPNLVPAHIKALFTAGSLFGGGIQTYGR